ncbi:MAG TPA: hypothetical protein PKW51_05440 [Methanoregulaceae archaeon]|nr:hypothetical protein [Methanoregulaceae archaeon]HPX73330.1 hypothetical protein [Methanoregulaceae archaeon]
MNRARQGSSREYDKETGPFRSSEASKGLLAQTSCPGLIASVSWHEISIIGVKR